MKPGSIATEGNEITMRNVFLVEFMVRVSHGVVFLSVKV
jgi:hypothetical protein